MNQFLEGNFWMIITTQQLQPLQNRIICLLNIQAIAGASVRNVSKILNTGKAILLEVRIVVTGGKVEPRGTSVS